MNADEMTKEFNRLREEMERLRLHHLPLKKLIAGAPSPEVL
jgi:hypothetical protein